MAELFKQCPSCGSDDDNGSIYRCENDHLYCTGCAGTVSAASLTDPLGLFTSKRVCPRCHSDSGEFVGEIEKQYFNYGGGSGYSNPGIAVSSSNGRFSRTSNSTGFYFVLVTIAYLSLAGGAWVLMEHADKYSFLWWLCGITIVAGIPLFIAVAYVTWYAALAIIVMWALLQIAEYFMHYLH